MASRARAGALAGAAQGFSNAGDALFQALLAERQQENEQRKQALAEEMGRGELAQNYLLHGFVPNGGTGAPAPSPAPSPVEKPDVFAGQTLGMETLPRNAGDALMQALRPQPSAPAPTPAPAAPAYTYNPAADPEAVRQRAQIDARTAEGAADRTNRIKVANINETGANERNAASIAAQKEIYGTTHTPPSVQAAAEAAAATLLKQNGNDPAKAAQAIEQDPETPAKQAILQVLQGLMFDQSRRNALHIGAPTFDLSGIGAKYGVPNLGQ